jgi:hypothetical protein
MTLSLSPLEIQHRLQAYCGAPRPRRPQLAGDPIPQSARDPAPPAGLLRRSKAQASPTGWWFYQLYQGVDPPPELLTLPVLHTTRFSHEPPPPFWEGDSDTGALRQPGLPIPQLVCHPCTSVSMLRSQWANSRVWGPKIKFWLWEADFEGFIHFSCDNCPNESQQSLIELLAIA